MKEKVPKMLVLILTLGMLAGCSADNEIVDDNSFYGETGNKVLMDDSFREDMTILLESINVDTDGILRQIERSRMPDFGYRISNVTLGEACPFDTFFITQAKMYAGLITDIDDLAMAYEFLGWFENTPRSRLHLIDIYTAIRLIGDHHTMLSDSARQIIYEFFDSSYCKRIGAYAFSLIEYDGRSSTSYIFPTYLVKTVMSILGMEGRSIDNWIHSTTEELLFHADNMTLESVHYAGLFPQMLELHRLMDLEVSKERFMPVIQKFENNLDNVEELSYVIYTASYFLGYLEFSLLLGHDSSNYHELIIQELTTVNRPDRLNIDTFTDSSQSFYMYVRSLYLAGHDFANDLNIAAMASLFDRFLLDEMTYIRNNSTRSNFDDTHFVNSILSILGVGLDSDALIFYENILSTIIQESCINTVYLYLKILSQNDSLHIIDPIKEEISYWLLAELTNLLDPEYTSELMPSITVSSIVSVINSLEILNQPWSVQQDQINDILENFQKSDDRPIDKIYNIRLKNLTTEQDLRPLLNQLSENLIYLTNSELNMIVQFQYAVLNVFKESSHAIPNNMIEAILNTLYNARHSSGLFKGGVNGLDTANLRNTYYALFMLQVIENIIIADN